MPTINEIKSTLENVKRYYAKNTGRPNITWQEICQIIQRNCDEESFKLLMKEATGGQIDVFLEVLKAKLGKILVDNGAGSKAALTFTKDGIFNHLAGLIGHSKQNELKTFKEFVYYFATKTHISETGLATPINPVDRTNINGGELVGTLLATAAEQISQNKDWIGQIPYIGRPLVVGVKVAKVASKPVNWAYRWFYRPIMPHAVIKKSEAVFNTVKKKVVVKSAAVLDELMTKTLKRYQ